MDIRPSILTRLPVQHGEEEEGRCPTTRPNLTKLSASRYAHALPHSPQGKQSQHLPPPTSDQTAGAVTRRPRTSTVLSSGNRTAALPENAGTAAPAKPARLAAATASDVRSPKDAAGEQPQAATVRSLEQRLVSSPQSKPTASDKERMAASLTTVLANLLDGNGVASA